jgi:hypothetical protein
VNPEVFQVGAGDHGPDGVGQAADAKLQACSIFDFITIIVLVYALSASPELFRTGWFLESVLSEIIITFAIRTRKRFYKSRL